MLPPFVPHWQQSLAIASSSAECWPVPAFGVQPQIWAIWGGTVSPDLKPSTMLTMSTRVMLQTFQNRAQYQGSHVAARAADQERTVKVENILASETTLSHQRLNRNHYELQVDTYVPSGSLQKVSKVSHLVNGGFDATARISRTLQRGVAGTLGPALAARSAPINRG